METIWIIAAVVYLGGALLFTAISGFYGDKFNVSLGVGILWPLAIVLSPFGAAHDLGNQLAERRRKNAHKEEAGT